MRKKNNVILLLLATVIISLSISCSQGEQQNIRLPELPYEKFGMYQSGVNAIHDITTSHYGISTPNQKQHNDGLDSFRHYNDKGFYEKIFNECDTSKELKFKFNEGNNIYRYKGVDYNVNGSISWIKKTKESPHIIKAHLKFSPKLPSGLKSISFYATNYYKTDEPQIFISPDSFSYYYGTNNYDEAVVRTKINDDVEYYLKPVQDVTSYST